MRFRPGWGAVWFCGRVLTLRGPSVMLTFCDALAVSFVLGPGPPVPRSAWPLLDAPPSGRFYRGSWSIRARIAGWKSERPPTPTPLRASAHALHNRSKACRLVLATSLATHPRVPRPAPKRPVDQRTLRPRPLNPAPTPGHRKRVTECEHHAWPVLCQNPAAEPNSPHPRRNRIQQK
jgi:hypothetical protein